MQKDDDNSPVNDQHGKQNILNPSSNGPMHIMQ